MTKLSARMGETPLPKSAHVTAAGIGYFHNSLPSRS
jgi:hypothetical protein